MSKKFLTKVVLATVLASGINLLPTPNFDAGNVQISVAYAESKNFAAKEAAMTDVEIIEAQAKEASRLRAIEAVKEKIAAYVRNFSGAKGKLSEDDIAAIAEKFEEVGEAKYKKLFYNAVDEEGKELGKVGIMYEATVTAKFNSKKITEYIKLTEQEKERRIRQARESREHFKELDREYEELRKNARTKTPEQLQSEIKNFDDKLSDLEKRKGKNKSAKKDKTTTQQDKIQPMRFSSPVEIGFFGYGERFTGTLIKGASYASEQPRYIEGHGQVYSKGVARFGNSDDAIYLHYGNSNFNIGSNDVKNTISYDYGYGATIFKINATNGYTMYLLKKVYYVPLHQEREFYVLIGQRPDGKWVKYFNTEDLCKQYMGNSKNVSIPKVSANGDTIIVNYARCNHLPKEMGGYFYEKLADEFGEFRFKWDEAAKWFSVEKFDTQNNATPQKTSQENKVVTNQPMQFSQPVKLSGIVGTVFDPKLGFSVENVTSNNGTFSGTYRHGKCYSKGVARIGSGDDALYAHYDVNKDWRHTYFGGENPKNTFPLFVTNNYQGEEIHKINSNIGITLYAIWTGFEMPDATDIYILGRHKDGKWVKYIDTENIRKTYFGENASVGFASKFVVKNDSVTLSYFVKESGRSFRMNAGGEFRFKWDEAAQWFSVEQIKY